MNDLIGIPDGCISYCDGDVINLQRRINSCVDQWKRKKKHMTGSGVCRRNRVTLKTITRNSVQSDIYSFNEHSTKKTNKTISYKTKGTNTKTANVDRIIYSLPSHDKKIPPKLPPTPTQWIT